MLDMIISFSTIKYKLKSKSHLLHLIKPLLFVAFEVLKSAYVIMFANQPGFDFGSDSRGRVMKEAFSAAMAARGGFVCTRQQCDLLFLLALSSLDRKKEGG